MFLNSSGMKMNSDLSSRSQNIVNVSLVLTLKSLNVSLSSSGCKWFLVCPFIFLHVSLSLLRFQTSMDMTFLSQLAYFVMQRFPAANFEEYSCSINAPYIAGRKECWEQRQRTPCLCRKQ